MSVNALSGQYSENLGKFLRLNRVADKLHRGNPNHKTRHSMDISSDDVMQLLKSLNAHKVKYLLVGGMAGVVHGHIRTTRIFNLWIKDSPENNEALLFALVESKIITFELGGSVLLKTGKTLVPFGRWGFELELTHFLNAFKTTDFDECYNRALTILFEGVPLPVIHLEDLITDKKGSTSLKDIADLEELERIWQNMR